MHGIVFTLTEKLAKQVRTCSHYLQTHFAASAVPTEPHCSLHICDQYAQPAVENYLTQLAPQLSPCIVPITGLGQFFIPELEDIVLYLSVVRTAKLNQIHQLLYQSLSEVSSEFSALYTPFSWQPHITFGHVSKAQLPAAIDYLAQFAWQQETMLSNLAIMESAEQTFIKRFEVAIG